MASNPRLSLAPEIGPDGIARESPVIAYTEKIIEEEQLQLKRYIKENYSKIRDVERELENLNLELKLTAGPKKAALEHMRKKIEVVNERIRAAKLNEEQTKKAWEAAAKVVKDEEAVKQKLCDDLNQLVQESAHTQYSRLEELKRRLEALNPNRASSDVSVFLSRIPFRCEGNSRRSLPSRGSLSLPWRSRRDLPPAARPPLSPFCGDPPGNQMVEEMLTTESTAPTSPKQPIEYSFGKQSHQGDIYKQQELFVKQQYLHMFHAFGFPNSRQSFVNQSSFINLASSIHRDS